MVGLPHIYVNIHNVRWINVCVNEFVCVINTYVCLQSICMIESSSEVGTSMERWKMSDEPLNFVCFYLGIFSLLKLHPHKAHKYSHKHTHTCTLTQHNKLSKRSFKFCRFLNTISMINFVVSFSFFSLINNFPIDNLCVC